MNHDELNLITGEKPSRTSVATVSEGHTFQIAGHPLCTSFRSSVACRLTDLLEAETLETLWVGESCRIHALCLGWNANRCSRRKDKTIGEEIITVNNPLEGD